MVEKKKKKGLPKPVSEKIESLIQRAIYPIVIVSGFFEVFAYWLLNDDFCFVAGDFLDTRDSLFCRGGGIFIVFDLLVVNFLLILVWSYPPLKYKHFRRIATLVYIIVVRFVLILLVASIQI